MWFIIDICSPKTWTESEFSVYAGNTLLFAGLGITVPPLSPAAPSVFRISIIPWAQRKAGPAHAENISGSCEKKKRWCFSVSRNKARKWVFFCPNANEDQPVRIRRVFLDSQWVFICACVFMYLSIYECHFGGCIFCSGFTALLISTMQPGRGHTSETSAVSPPSSNDSLVQSYPKPLLHKCAFFWHSIRVPCTYLGQHMLKLVRKENVGDGGVIGFYYFCSCWSWEVHGAVGDLTGLRSF